MEDDLKNINKSVEEFFKSYNDSNRKHSHSNLADYLLQKHDYSIVESYIESFVEEQGKINPGFNEISFNEFKKFKNNINLDINVPNDSYLKNYFNISDKDAGEYVNTGDYIDEDLADGDMMNAQYDSEIEIPDTVPEDLVEEVDRERFREFLELQEPEGTVLYDDAEVAEQAEANRQSRLTPQESDEFVDIVNQYNNQLDNVLDNIPIEKAVKKRIRNKTAELSARLFTPGGPLIDALDFYETAVFGLGMIIAAAPELKNIASYYSTLAANHIGKAYGMNIPVDKLEPDWERINKVMDQVEAVTPTDILIIL